MDHSLVIWFHRFFCDQAMHANGNSTHLMSPFLIMSQVELYGIRAESVCGYGSCMSFQEFLRGCFPLN